MLGPLKQRRRRQLVMVLISRSPKYAWLWRGGNLSAKQGKQNQLLVVKNSPEFGLFVLRIFTQVIGKPSWAL